MNIFDKILEEKHEAEFDLFMLEERVEQQEEWLKELTEIIQRLSDSSRHHSDWIEALGYKEALVDDIEANKQKIATMKQKGIN